MKLNTSISKTTVITFAHRTNSVNYNYKLCNRVTACTQCVKDLGILLHYKLHIHNHANYIYIYSQGLRILGSICCITFSFSTIDTLTILYNAIVRSEFMHVSIAWNSITLNDSSKLEEIQRKFAALYHSRLFIDTCYNRYNEESLPWCLISP